MSWSTSSKHRPAASDRALRRRGRVRSPCGDVFAIDLGCTTCPGATLQIVSASRRRTSRGQAFMLGERDQLPPKARASSGPAWRRLGAGGRSTSSASSLRTACARRGARSSLSAPPSSFHKAAPGPINGRTADFRLRRSARRGLPHRQPKGSAPASACAPRPAAAQKCRQLVTFRLAEFDAISYIHPSLLAVQGADESSNESNLGQNIPATEPASPHTGAYLAFIYAYTRVLGVRPRSRHAATLQGHRTFRPPNGAHPRTKRARQTRARIHAA